MEREIVVAACAGDASAFAAIVEEFTPTVLAAAYGLCGDRHLAADIAQEAFATAYVKIPTLRDPAALPGWLMAITRSSARVARPRRVAAPLDVATPGVDDQVVAADEARRLRRAVEALPTAERLPMALHYFAGRRLADIAELCDLPVSTVKKRMRTARGRIRQQGSEMIMDNTLLVSDESRSDPSDVVRMFSAMRTGDAALVAAMLDSRPDLVDVREDWTREEGRRHRLPWTTRGGTPLLRAVERGDTAMVELLLSRGADPDAQCSCEGGESPVWVAAAQHDKRSLELLLAHGANPNRPAFAGLTPLDVATVRGYDDLVELLRCAGGQPSNYQAFVDTRPCSAATGIKAIDLWCPLPQQGLVHVAPGYGLGAIVLLNELSRRAAITGQRVVWTGFVPSPLDLGDLHHAVAESGIADHVLLALAAPDAPEQEKAAALDVGMAAAADGGLLVVFNETGHLLTIDQRLMELAERPGTTIVVAPLQATTEPPQQGTRPFLASIAFDTSRAARGRWPAISSESWSLVATPQMATLAQQARLAMTDELDQYLSQPFHVAEHILGIPGETVEPAELHSEVSKRIGTTAWAPTPSRHRPVIGTEESLTPAPGRPQATGSTTESNTIMQAMTSIRGIETRLRATEGRVAAANGLDVKERWVDIASPPVRVRVLEAGSGDPVMFINGISAPGIGMAPLVGRLPGHRHLLIDLPGHGLSPPYPWQGAPLREQAVDVIGGLLDGLDIDQVTLVGNSLGGLFSLWFALDRPSRVARAVIVGQPGVAIKGSRGSPMMGVLTAPVLGWVATWIARLPAPRFSSRLALRDGSGAHAARLVSNDIVDLHALPMRLPGQATSFRSLQKRLLVGRTARPENVLTDAELRNFSVPLLFVWPDDDRFLAPAAGKPSVDKIPSARFVTMPGGHFPWYDDPDKCAALVAEGL